MPSWYHKCKCIFYAVQLPCTDNLITGRIEKCLSGALTAYLTQRAIMPSCIAKSASRVALTQRKGEMSYGELFLLRGTQREYSSKPLKHSIVKRI